MLMKQLEEVQKENELLQWQQSEQFCPVLQSNGEAAVHIPAAAVGSETWAHSSSNSPDAMELPRMRRKVQQLQNELRRTKTKLLNSQKTMQVCKLQRLV